MNKPCGCGPNSVCINCHPALTMWKDPWDKDDPDQTREYQLSQKELDDIFKGWNFSNPQCVCGAEKTSNPNLHARYCPKFIEP